MLIKGHFYMLVDTNSPWYTAIIVRHYSGMIRGLSREAMEKGAVVSSRVQETLSGMDLVKIFKSEERGTARLLSLVKEVGNIWERLNDRA